MFVYEKKLQYPVRIANPNPKLAAFIISQYGGPDGKKIYYKRAPNGSRAASARSTHPQA